MTISDDRLTSPKVLAFMEKLHSAKKAAYAAQGIPTYIIVDGKPREHFTEVYTLTGDEYRLTATVPANARREFEEPFPFVLDMKQINS